jgi:tetratricopeptide (TPR) repeat protein
LASPQNLTASQHDLMAIAYERAGYVEKAVLSLQEAIALEDTSKRHLEFGKLLYRNQLYEKAIEPLNVAYTKAKKKGLPLYLLGQCFLNMNNYNKATTLFVKAKKYRSVRSNAKNALSLIKHIQRMQQESVTG